MDDGVQALRDAAVALRREWEEPERPGRWSDVAVWFGTLGLLGPRATRGVGAFASFVLISRTWAAAHRRHTRSVNDVIGRLVEAVTEDLEDRAAVDAAVDELAERVHGITDSIGEMGESLTSLEAGRVDVGEVGAGDEALREYLDDAIRVWRGNRDRAQREADRLAAQGVEPGLHASQMRAVRQAEHYIDAFQSARVSVLGELLPEVDGRDDDIGGGERALRAHRDAINHALGERAYPYEDGDTLVIGPEAFVALPGEVVISWRGENYYRDGNPMRDGGVGCGPGPVGHPGPSGPTEPVTSFNDFTAIRVTFDTDRGALAALIDNPLMLSEDEEGAFFSNAVRRGIRDLRDAEPEPRDRGPFDPPGGLFDRRERAVVADTGHRRRKSDREA